MNVRKIKLKALFSNSAIMAGFWFTICSILQRGISIITMPIYTRLMPTEQFGEYSIFQTWYNILIIIITLNIHQEIFNKGLSNYSEQKDEYTANQMGLLFILTFFFLIIYYIFKNAINNLLGLSTYLVIIMIFEILANAIFGLWSTNKRFKFEYTKIVIVTLVISILNPIVGIIAVYFSKYKAQARIISNALIPIILAIFLIINIAKKGKIFHNIKWWKNSILKSLPLIPHYLSLVLLNQSDKLMINEFCGVEFAGIYSVAHAAGLLTTIVNTSINNAFVPWAYDKLKHEKEIEIKKNSNILFFIVLLINAIVIWFSPEAIKIIAASEYQSAIWCLIPIVASVFFYFIYMLFVDIEIYYGENKLVAIASLFAAILNIILNYIFIPIFGYIAAGYTTLFSYFMTMLLHYIFMKITLKKNNVYNNIFDEKKIIIFSILLIFILGMSVVLYKYFYIRLIIVIVCSILIYIKKYTIINFINENLDIKKIFKK